jgi:enoyl-CoA hydratase
MEKLKTLHTGLESGILKITLNQPEKKNVLSMQCMEELRTVIQQVYDRPDIQSALITGAGEELFSVGADVQELQGLTELNGRKFAEQGQETFALIEACHKPIVAAINGHAWAEGCELALACHLRVAATTATFAFPQITRGSIPGFGGTQRLTQLIGKTRALELLLTGSPLSAVKAKEIGLVNYLGESQAEVIQKSKEILLTIMANAPLAVGAVLNCVNAVYNPDENGYQTEANSFANRCKAEGMKVHIATSVTQQTTQFIGT